MQRSQKSSDGMLAVFRDAACSGMLHVFRHRMLFRNNNNRLHPCWLDGCIQPSMLAVFRCIHSPEQHAAIHECNNLQSNKAEKIKKQKKKKKKAAKKCVRARKSKKDKKLKKKKYFKVNNNKKEKKWKNKL